MEGNVVNFDEMYLSFEDRYNKYPVQMSRASAFGRALDDGLITKAIYSEARKYYGDLWFYVGD